MAYEHLLAAAPDLDAQQLDDDIVQRHRAPYIKLGLRHVVRKPGPHEIEREYPRGNFSSQVGTVIFDREFKEKPNCLLSHFPGWDDKSGQLCESKLDALLKAVPVGSLGESE
ncbi:hypothetical protein DFH09DRAFT_1292754 [Mycena vulgaris]|nr:hypothetical protein DFH09DRAFT_1292754 [Mycena vulgaris]